jgi:hypothetical protein
MLSFENMEYLRKSLIKHAKHWTWVDGHAPVETKRPNSDHVVFKLPLDTPRKQVIEYISTQIVQKLADSEQQFRGMEMPHVVEYNMEEKVLYVYIQFSGDYEAARQESQRDRYRKK